MAEESERIIRVPEQFAKKAHIGSMEKYRALYDRSVSDPDGFWNEQAERITWFKKWKTVSKYDFHTANIEWFIGGKLNASANCLDRHLKTPRRDKPALVWEGDSPGESRTLSYRGGRIVPLKQTTDESLKECPGVKSVVMLKRTGKEVPFSKGRDQWWHDLVRDVPTECEPEQMDAEDPLFILYTSGSTGKPKGVLHTTGGYMVYVALTHELIFDLREEDIFWCTADVGWVTGHSYIVYGPLANGATSLMFEGVPQYPDWGRFWDIVDKYKVTILYTAPTAIRAIAREGEGPVKSRSRKSLRLLGTVGEAINPEVGAWDSKGG